MKAILLDALYRNIISVTDEAVDKLLAYLNLLKTWNKVFNLTAITDDREMVYLHIIDSLAVAQFLKGRYFLDVGSGAGLPGIPLAICYPEQQWVLIDKNNKKTRFQVQAIAELGLKNVQAIHSRCEDFHKQPGFDTIISRAFTSLAGFVESTQHLLKPGGEWLAMKGKYPEEEIEDLPQDVKLALMAKLIKKEDIWEKLLR